MNSQWESNPQVKGLYVIQTFQPRIERDSLILNAPSRGYGRRFSTWEIEHTTASRPKVLRIPMGWLALGVWRYCQTSLFPSCNCTFWTWKGFPVGFKPTRQVSSSASLHGRSRTSGGCATWHSHRGSASIYFAMGNWKIVLKGNLSWSGQHGSITPLLFLIPDTWTCLFSRRHMVALNQSQATYQGYPW